MFPGFIHFKAYISTRFNFSLELLDLDFNIILCQIPEVLN